MANFKQHACFGAAAGALTYIGMCKYYKRNIDFGEMLACAGVGTVASMIPDIIEPAITPNHRSLAHSVTAGSALLRFATDRCCTENRNWEELQKILWASATAGYLSHLVADGCTPRSLPLLS